MTEQAVLAFRVNGREFDTYAHDGEAMLRDARGFVADVRVGTARAWARALREVDPSTLPDDGEIQTFMGWADLAVSSGALTDWYCLLRRAQGNPGAILRTGIALVCDPSTRPFARLRLLLDLDGGMVEVWTRGPWLMGPVSDFSRVASVEWSLFPGTDVTALVEAADLIRSAREERS